MPIPIEIVTQRGHLFSGEADMVVAPGIEGQIGILPNHSALITPLDCGELRVILGDTEQEFAICGGIIDVRPNKIVVLVDAGERVEEIDLAAAEAARARAKKMLEEGPPPERESYEQILAELRHAELAIKIRRRTQSRAGTVRIRDEA